MEDYLKKIRKFNWWDENLINPGYSRSLYAQKIKNFIGNKLIKVLVGQRRTGKSYILRQIISDLIKSGVSPENTLYINKEFLEFDFLKTYEDLERLFQYYKAQLQPEGKVYLFIDEIQNVKEWERFVNSKSQDFVEEYEIFITGSNSKLLSGELATLLSGRYVEFEILPFSYEEFIDIKDLESGRTSFLEYMQTSGLPELMNLPDQETKRHYVSSVMDTVLLRDVIERHSIKNPALLKDIFIYLINNTSNLVSINNIVKYFKGKNRRTTYDTLANYISNIEETFLIHRAERYDIRGKEIIGGTYKFYANDVGFRNYLFSGFGYGLGYLLENIVYLQLRRYSFDIHVGQITDREVDFIAKKHDQTLYVQVCLTGDDAKTLEREYRALEAIPDNFPKLIVSMDDYKLPYWEGIAHLQAWEFESYLAKLY